MSLEHARKVIAKKQEDYHSIRPHSSQGTLTPEEFLVQQTEFRQNYNQGKPTRHSRQ